MQEQEPNGIYVLFSPMESLIWACHANPDGKYKEFEIGLSNEAVDLIKKCNPDGADLNSKTLMPFWRKLALEATKTHLTEIGPDLLRKYLDEL